MTPHRTTPIFDADTLPAGLRKEHSTKAGVWGIVRVLEGSLHLDFGDGQPPQVVAPGSPGLLLPEQPHWVTPQSSMRMQVEFYRARPALEPGDV